MRVNKKVAYSFVLYYKGNMIEKPLHPRVEKLFSLAESKGLTSYKIAQLSGLHRNTVYYWQIGRTLPDMDSYEAAMAAVKAYGKTSKK